MMDVQELLLIFLGGNGIVVKTFLVLQQWFSMGGVDFAPPRGHLVMSGDTLFTPTCHN